MAGASTMQEAPCNARTVRRPVMQNSASNWSGATHTGTYRRGSCSGSGRENRQICTPGVPWPQRPVPEPCLNKYSFSIFLTTCFSGFEIGFTYADRGTREKAGDKRLLPSAVFLSGQRCAQLAAGRQSVIVRSLVADHAFAGQIGAVVVAAGLPAAHPFAVAPAVGAEQSDVLPAQPALTGGEHGLELALLQLLRPHGGAAKGDGGILADLLRRELCGGNHRHLGAFALGAFGHRHCHGLGVSRAAPIHNCNFTHKTLATFLFWICYGRNINQPR